MGGYLIGNQLDMTMFVDTAISMSLFYHLGRSFYFSGLYTKRIHWSAVVSIFLGYTAFIIMFIPKVETKDNIYPIYLVLLSMPIIYALYQISLYLAEHMNTLVHFFENCGKSSLTLLGMHRPLWLIVYPICLNLNLSTIPFIGVQMVSALLITLPLHQFLRKNFPVLIGLKK